MNSSGDSAMSFRQPLCAIALASFAFASPVSPGGIAAHAAQTVEDNLATTGPLKIERLSSAQLVSMPAATIVVLQTGRRVSLGDLRAEHTARLARFANARTLALRMRPKQLTGGTGYALVTMTVDPHGAADYQAFCQAAAASGCLYFPGPAGYFSHLAGQKPNLLFDYDPLVTDPGVCGSQGGIIVSANSPAGCAYGYPYTYSSNFNPGPTLPGHAIGAFIKVQQTCTPPVSVNVDHNGAIAMQGNFAASGSDVVTTSMLTCAVWVSAPGPNWRPS
jgi:hypothetical protein